MPLRRGNAIWLHGKPGANQTIALHGSRTSQNCSVHPRSIRFRDAEKAKTVIFLANQTALAALTICGLYKSR